MTHNQPPQQHVAPFLAAMIWPVGVLAFTFSTQGLPAHPERIGYLAAFMVLPWLVSAAATWAIFRNRPVNFLVLMVVTLPIFFVLFGALGAARFGLLPQMF